MDRRYEACVKAAVSYLKRIFPGAEVISYRQIPTNAKRVDGRAFRVGAGEKVHARIAAPTTNLALDVLRVLSYFPLDY